VWGESLATGIAHGIGADGVHGMTHTTNGAGVSGGNDAAGGIGVYGYATNNGCFGTNSNVQQSRNMGGWVKAMAYVDPFAAGGIAITRCYNSQATGSAVSTPPCGMQIVSHTTGQAILDFGFQVSDRFISVTAFQSGVVATGGYAPNSCTINQSYFATYFAQKCDRWTIHHPSVLRRHSSRRH